MLKDEDPTRRAFMRALAARGALSGASRGCLAAAAAVVAARALAPDAAGAMTLAAPVLAALASAAGALLALRRAPSREACAAMTEDATHAGGRLLVDGVPGAEAWSRPAPVPAPVPPRLRPRPARLVPALAALALAFAVPARWFAAAEPAPPRAFPDITADIRNEIEDIREEESLDSETVEELAEELKRIEETADPSDPGAALDAAERLRERVAVLLELNSETLKRIVKDPGSLERLASDPEAAMELQRMLDESGAGECPDGEERPGGRAAGDGEGDGECEGDGEGDGGKPGDGSPARGRADAEMLWTRPSELGGSEYRDVSREATPGENAEEGKVGESISGEDPTAVGARSARAAASFGGRSTGASLNRTVAPRHRGTVRRFFETERKNR